MIPFLPAPPPAQVAPRPLRTFAQIEAKLQQWRKSYPELVQLSTLPGKTREGRAIPLVQLGKSRQAEVLLLSGIHPREQQPAVCVLRFFDELLAGYAKGDPQARRLLDTRTIYLVPLFNVDGKLFEERQPDWRKNRVANSDGSFGVDLNRNFPIRWGGARERDALWNDTTARPGADIYEGTAPLSEPENQALDRFFATHPRLHAFLDIHSPLREILFPAYSIGPDYLRFAKIAQGMRERQGADPYATTKAQPGTEPAPGARSGNSGLTYTHAYYSYGIYGFNFEISTPGKERGVAGRYPTEEAVEKEYDTRVRDAWLYFLEQVGELPLPQPGKLTLSGGGTTDRAITPGATLAWTPPSIPEPCAYAVVVSHRPEIVVLSEYRNVPVKTPFTLQIASEAKPGTTIPLTLHLWDRERHHSIYTFTLTVASPTQ